MALFDNDLVFARRALAHALGEYMDRGRVRDAVALWSPHFEGQGSVSAALNRYCRHMADSFGVAGREAELQLKIFRALQTDPQELPQDPLSVPPDDAPTQPAGLSDTARAGPSSLPASTPLGRSPGGRSSSAGCGAALLQAFYAAIEEQLARDLPPDVTLARIRRTLIRHATTLPRPQQHAASLWWSGQVSALDGEWPAGGHGTALVNVIYIALAELLGPVRADQCFTQAVARLEASGDSARTNIRRYL
jgi:hypothetical protein